MKRQSTILIVDDEPFARDIMEGFLFNEGYELAFAASGAEVLANINELNPDVILLDVMMPDMDGLEVCQRLKADERWRHVPIILVTALGSKSDVAQGLEAGADDFLHKPVDDLELRARVRSMLRVKKQYDELEATLRLREDLARMIVHDMRNPLSVIVGFSEVLLMKDTVPAEVMQNVKSIHAQARRLNSFLNDMLILAKMEAGHPILNPLLSDVNQLVRQVAQSQDVIARSKQIDFIINLPPEAPYMRLDANLFQRVLDNLISNALKFSPAGTTVKLEVESLRESPVFQSPEPQLRIKVVDEGPGIADEHRDHIFDKFEIVALKQNGAAQVGLGLAFCKMVVEAHGGRIFVEANKPVGSVFIIEV